MTSAATQVTDPSLNWLFKERSDEVTSASTDHASWSRWLQSQVDSLAQPTTSTRITIDEKPQLALRIRRAFQEATDEIFENGMESEFSRKLTSILTRFGDAAVDCILSIVNSRDVNDETAGEALRSLARMDHPVTQGRGLWLLEYSLFNKSSRIRDAAVIGLGHIDDPQAIPYVELALKRETQPELRSDMAQLLDQLKETSLCRES